jgi:hypothetical protein
LALYETGDARAERRRRVLLTGATGYIAGQLLPAFRERYDLRLIDVRETDASGNGVEGIEAFDLLSDEDSTLEPLFSDVDETIGFYRMLGIEEAFRLHHDDGSLMLVYLHISGDRFIEVSPGGPSPDSDREQSFMHLKPSLLPAGQIDAE